MTSRTQQQRAETPNAPPANGSLLPGQLYVELADPVKLWAGVPPGLLPAGVKLIYDSTSAGVALDKTGDTASGLINFNGGINVPNTPANVPLAAPDTNTQQAASTSWVLGQAETNPPLVDGAAAPGSRTRWSRGDHVHPTDTTRAPLASPALTGSPTATTPPVDDNSTRISNTQWVMGQGATTPPLMDGTATPGVATRWARADHVHPPDTTRGTVIVGDVPPSNPNPGSFWFDSVGVQLYIYYQDPNSTQWVPVNNQALAGFLALTGGIMQGPITMNGPAPAANQVPTYSQAVAPNTGRNLVDNAMFNIQQRGAGPFTTLLSYAADRWYIGGSTDTVSFTFLAASDAMRTAVGDEAMVHFLSNTFTGSSAAGAYNEIVQRIEGVRRLAGKTVTVSFYAAASVAGLKLGINGAQAYGTGGSPSALDAWQATGASVTLNPTWARYQATLTVPTSVGKTLGSNGDDNSWVRLGFSSGATSNAYWGNIGVQSGTIQIWGIQVEIGSQATPLEKLDPATDLARCQRFYQVGTAILQAGGYSGEAFTVSYTFPVTMRAAPTLYVPNWNATNLTGGTASTGANGNVSAYFGGVGASTAWCAFNAPFTASADL